MSDAITRHLRVLPVPALLGLVALIVAEYCAPLLPRDTWESAFIKEDRLIELPGSLALLLGSVVLVLAFRRLRRVGDERRWLSWAVLGLAVLFFLAFGEEISWGQRILGFETPKSLDELNEQHEINLHNLELFSGLFSADRLFQLFWFGFGVVVPVAAAASARARAWLVRWLPILPLVIAALLVLNQFAADLAHALLEGRYSSRYPLGYSITETKEAVVEIILATGVLVWYRRIRNGEAPAGEVRAS